VISGARSRPRSIRESRKEAIISAAAEVLRTQGVAACTVRNIADVGNVSKSAIHYYFDEIDDIVDLAFERLLVQFIDRIERAASECDDPFEAVWAAAAEYLRTGSDGPDSDRAPMLAFDYHVAATRRGNNGPMIAISEQFALLLQRLVRETGVPDGPAIADTLFSALVGSVVRTPLETRDPGAVLDGLSRALHLPRSLTYSGGPTSSR
jgi:AcrR family transcriptional regulator